MNVTFTSEELKNIVKQPKDSCPYLNYVLHSIESKNLVQDEKNKVESNLDSAKKIIKNIIVWQKDWEKILEKQKIEEHDDPFVEAYIQAANETKKRKTIDLDNSITTLNEGFEDFQNELRNCNMSNELVFFNKDEKEENTLYIEMKKNTLIDTIEDIRRFAINQRGIGQHYKDAYKQISISNDFNDIIQPQEVILEEQDEKDVFVIGILNHEKTTDALIKNDIFDEIEGLLFEKMNTPKKIEFLQYKLKNNDSYDQNKIAFYETMSDFQNKNKYKVVDIDSNVKLKSKKQFKTTNKRAF